MAHSKIVPSRLGYLVLLGAFYVCTHALLQYLSAGRVQREWGVPDMYLYVPAHPTWVVTNEFPLRIHYALRHAFYPVWKTQQHLFGGPTPMQFPPMLEIGDSPNQLSRANSLAQ